MRDSEFKREGPSPETSVRRDVEDEMEFHVAALADKYTRAGVTAEEARRMAQDHFGNRQHATEECVDIDHARLAQASSASWLDHVGRDIRHGLRRLRGSPTFTIVTILTLALGIGPLIAIFSILNNVLLRPLPFANADDLVIVQESFPLPNGRSGLGSVSYPNFLDWQAQAKTISLAASTYAASGNLEDPSGSERLAVDAIDANVLPTLGVQPSLGRNFLTSEARANGPSVVIISDALWRRRYNASPSVLGQTFVLDGVAQTIVGVMPADVTYPSRSAAVDVWRPLQLSTDPSRRGNHSLFVIGRLKAGETIDHAGAEMKQIAAGLATLYPAAQFKRSAAVTSYTESLVGRTRPQLYVLLGAAAFVLLIAAANAASLLLARAGTKQRDVAVLAALGASRGRIVQQFLIESLILSALGAVAGVLLSSLAVRGILSFVGTTLPRGTTMHDDWRVLAFVICTMLLTTVLCGVVPALRASQTNAQQALREGGRGGTGGRERTALRSGLVVAQFALSLVLLAGAGLMMRTLVALLGTNTGMSPEHVLTLRLPVPVGSPRYPTPADAATRFYVPMLAAVRALPGVEHAGVINLLPLQQSGSNGNFGVVGKSYATPAEQPFAEFRVVSAGYFDALKIPILRGRDVADTDVATSEPVALINDVAAKQIFGSEDPVGRQLAFGPITPQNPAVTIVGVVGSVRQARLETPPAAELYFSTGQAGSQLANMSLVVRLAGDPTQPARAIEAAIAGVDRLQPVFGVLTMDEVVSQSVSDRELYFGLLGVFAAIALVMAMAGIYGVIAYIVTQRTKEFGIRLALGSEVGQVQRMVIWHGAKLALVGLAIGVPAAYLLSGLLSAALFGVQPTDPVTLGSVSLLLIVVGLVACYLPARRVTRVNPMIAMRAE